MRLARVREEGDTLRYHFECTDSAWDEIKNEFKDRFPFRRSSRWDAARKEWTLYRSDKALFAEYLGEYFEPYQVMWDEYHVMRTGPRRAAPPPPKPEPEPEKPRDALDEAAQVLGVTRTTDPAIVERAFRKTAMKVHPDTGGSHKAMLQVRDAIEVFRKFWAQSEAYA